MLSKQTTETFAVQQYLKTAEINALVLPNLNDPPDVSININNSLIGCEVTRYSNNSRLNLHSFNEGREKFINEFFDKLKINLKAKYPFGYMITVNFYSNLNSKSDLDEEVNSVSQKILKNFRTGTINIKSKDVDSVRIEHLKFDNTLETCFALSTFKDTTSTELIFQNLRHIIRNKTKANWNGNYNEKWLLITFGNAFANTIVFKKLKKFKIDQSEFWDKLIFLNLADNKIIEHDYK